MELTGEQIEAAAKAMYEANPIGRSFGLRPWNTVSKPEKELWHPLARAAAPLLQTPWEIPTDEECETIYREVSGRDAFTVPAATRIKVGIQLFVRYRNASLVPKPVDPRREKVIEMLVFYLTKTNASYEHIADRILAALDAKE